METQLLIEELSPSVSNIIVQESADNFKNCFLSGVFMQADIKNRNGRVYPLSEISRVVEAANMTIKETNGIFGELDHPQTLNINSDRVSHVITELRMDGTNAVGRMRILPTPMGVIARQLIESGVRMGVSSRGAGQVSDSGVVEQFSFVTADIVITPSAPGATPTAVYESLQRSKHGGEIMKLSEQLKHDPAAQAYFRKEIMKFLNEGLFTKRK